MICTPKVRSLRSAYHMRGAPRTVAFADFDKRKMFSDRNSEIWREVIIQGASLPDRTLY